MAHADGPTRWSTVLGPVDDDEGYHNGELGVWVADGVVAARVGMKVRITKLQEKLR